MRRLAILALLLAFPSFGQNVTISGVTNLAGTITFGVNGDTATYPNLQARGSAGWTVLYGTSCCGGSNSGTGTGAWGIASPSLSGGSMSLTNVYTGSAGNGLNSQMYTTLDCSILSGGSCLSANNIQAEVHYYIPSSSAAPQALEGPNVVLYDGTDQEYPSLQCNSVGGHWWVWNSGGSTWVDTGNSCTAALTTNTWHDLVANYAVDGVAHTLRYVSATLDGTSIGTLGQSYSGEPDVTAVALKAQVQLDGNEAGASTTVAYYDKYDVTVTTNPTAATPTASPAAGTYSSAQSVTLSTSTSGATICYTTDGSTPAASTPGTCSAGTTYSTAISVASSLTIKALATEAGYINSGILSAAYTISGSALATPVLAPFAMTEMAGNTANSSPTSPTTGDWTGCAGTNPCLTFGKQGTGTSSMAIPISISNCAKTTDLNGNTIVPQCTGSGSVTVTSMAITGANAADFAIGGTCGTIAANGTCKPTITFTPSATSGTNEAATLTVDYSGATVASQTMSLTGQSATVTTLAACGTLADSTNYQATGDLTATGSCFTGAWTDVDLNLNGHTLTYCTGGMPQIVITAYSVSGTTVTFTANNSLTAGTNVTLNLYAGPTAMSGNTYSVLAAGLSSTQFAVTASGQSGSGAASGTAGNGVLAGAFFVNGFGESGLTVHNGTVKEATGLYCNGLTTYSTGEGFGSGVFITSSTGSTSDSKGNAFFNLNLAINDDPGNVISEEYAGATTADFSILHDVSMTMNGSFNCPNGDVGCRSADEHYAYIADGTESAAPFVFYNIGETGGTQGGIGPLSPSSTLAYSVVSPGSTVATNSNGFAYQQWNSGTGLANVLTTGTGANGSCLSCRGFQLASIGAALTGSTISGLHLYTTYLANNDEYSGCALGGSYAAQLNTAGNGYDLSGNTITDSVMIASAGPCDGFGFGDSGATNSTGANVVENSVIGCNIVSATYVSGTHCAGLRLAAQQYSPDPDNAIDYNNDTIFGDTADVYLIGTPARTFTGDTFGKGANPISSGFLFVNVYDGFNQGATPYGPLTFVNPSFVDGVTESSNNYATAAGNNTGLSEYYTIQFTYQVTALKSSNGTPISGATVTMTDSKSTVECSATTNASGIATCTVNENRYGMTGGSAYTTNYNPYSLSVAATGCTTDSESGLTITAKGTKTVSLSGC